MHVRDGSRNIGIIEKSLGELDGKLQYESGKMQGYAADLEQAESRLIPTQNFAIKDVRICWKSSGKKSVLLLVARFTGMADFLLRRVIV